MSPIQQPRFRFHAILFEMLRVFLGRPAKDDPSHDAVQETEGYKGQGIVFLRPKEDGLQSWDDMFGSLDIRADGSKGHSADCAMRSIVLCFEHLRKRSCLWIVVEESKELTCSFGLCFGRSGNKRCTGNDGLLEKHLFLLGNMAKYTMCTC